MRIFDKIGYDVKRKINDVCYWAGDHKTEVAGALTALYLMSRQGIKIARDHKNDMDRKTRIYDHSEGHYWYTKRPLRSDEYLELERLTRTGISKG